MRNFHSNARYVRQFITLMYTQVRENSILGVINSRTMAE